MDLLTRATNQSGGDLGERAVFSRDVGKIIRAPWEADILPVVHYLTKNRRKARGSGRNLPDAAAQQEARGKQYRHAIRTHGRDGKVIDSELKALFQTYSNKSNADKLKVSTVHV